MREWLSAQAAAGYVRYAGDGRYELPEEHALPLTDETSPACVIGAFEVAGGAAQATDRIAEAFVTGDGVGWGDQHPHVHTGCERFFRPGYINFLTTNWIPSLDGVEARLGTGIEVADVGCGHGASAVHMAQAYPNSRFTGFDPHDGSIETARKRAADAGVTDRVKFECATAGGLTESYDLIAFFDCLHDLGDPVGALRSARDHLNDGGTVLLVEPMAGDQVEDNLNPVGAAYYALSTLLCTPNAISQERQLVLGAQAGEARLRQVASQAGLSQFRRVAETPFNLVFELRV